MLDFIKSCFELGFTRDYVGELSSLIRTGEIVGTDLISRLTSVLIPIGLSLVALFWTLELLNKTIRFKEGGLGWEHILMLIAKLALAIGVVRGAPGIIDVLTDLGETILTSVGTVASEASQANFDALWTEVEGMGVVKQLLMVVQLLPLGLISMILSFLVRIVIYGRAVKLIIFSAFSPLPASTAFFEDYRDIFKRFLQNYLAACLQGAVIIMVIMLSKQLHSVSILGVSSDISVASVVDVPKVFARYAFINTTLLFCLIKSESWASKIIGL